MRTPFTGVGTALVSPFTRGGSLDEAAVRSLARRQIDAGVHFLCPCGTTGESPTLTDAERLRTVEIFFLKPKGCWPILDCPHSFGTDQGFERDPSLLQSQILSFAPALSSEGHTSELHLPQYHG